MSSRVLIEESGKTIDWVMDKGAEMRAYPYHVLS